MSQKTAICLVDLTALFDSRKRPRGRKKIDYAKFSTFLILAAGLSSIDDFDDFKGYTLYSSKNQEQVDFVNNLKKLNWDVETFGIHELETLEQFDVPTPAYRFNANISLEIGAALETEVNTVMLVTNSFDMYHVIKEAHNKDPEIEFILVYFDDHMDGRWEKALNQSKDFIRFVNLNDIYRLPEQNSETA